MALVRKVQRSSGAITFGDLVGRLDMLRVACSKCDRVGRYSVASLIECHGANAGLPDWKEQLTTDCPLRAKPAVWNLCGARFPDLAAALYGSEGRRMQASRQLPGGSRFSVLPTEHREGRSQCVRVEGPTSQGNLAHVAPSRRCG